MKNCLLLLVTVVTCIISFAQTRVLSGKVVSMQNGTVLPNVTVLVKGENRGTSTGKDGKYSLTVPGTASTLVFSFIGYASQEVAITGNSVIDIGLVDTATTLSNVIVTAAGIRRQRNTLGYSVSTLQADQIAQKSESNPIRALEGKVAGVNIQGSGGTAGGATNITIRGNSSLSNNNQPLFVVDGVPFDNSSFANVGTTTVGASAVTNRAYDIDPNNILSMTVLKGAAAAALYGSRAANGAIIITTKAGKKQSRKGLEITYNSSYAVENVSGFPDYQTSYGQGTNFDYRWGVYGSWGPPYAGAVPGSLIASRDSVPWQLGRQTSVVNPTLFPQYYNANGTLKNVAYAPYSAYNLKKFFQTGSLFENAISISSGTEKGNFTAGLSRSDNQGVVPNNTITRTSMSIGGNARLENKFYVSGSLNYVKTDQKTPPIGGSTENIMGVLMYLPTSFNLTDYPYKNPVDGSNIYDYTGVDNPYWLAQYSPATSSVDRYYGNFVLGYDPLPWLNIQNTIGFNAYTDRRMNVRGKGSTTYPSGSIQTDNIYRQELDNNLLATVTQSITKDLAVRGIVGFNINQRLTQRQAIYGDGIINPGIYSLNNTQTLTPVALGNGWNNIKQRFYAVFTDITLDYRKFLSLNLVGRNDVSSTLPASNRSYYYGGANGAFIFTNVMDIPKNVLSLGKVRAGYTRVGNEASPYQTINVYQTNTSLGGIGTPFTPSGGAITSVLSLSDLSTNPNLKPEFITELELGTELQFLHNRIGVDFTFYNKKSTSQIFTVSAAPSSGYLTQIINLGQVNNQGIEIGLNLVPVRTASFTWNIAANFTRNRNMVRNLGPYSKLAYNGTDNVHIVGRPYGLIQGAAYARDSVGHILVNPQTGKPLTVSAQPIGNPNPDFFMGVANTFHFKGFTLDVLFDWKQGASLYSSTTGEAMSRGVTRDTEKREMIIMGPGVLGDPNTLKPLLDARGNEIPNNVGITVADYYFASGFGPGGVAEGTIFDATVFRIREASLGYELPKSFLKNTPFGSATISLSGRNLWYKAPNFPQYMNFDPEVSSGGAGNGQGYDNLTVPTTKRFGANLRFSF